MTGPVDTGVQKGAKPPRSVLRALGPAKKTTRRGRKARAKIKRTIVRMFGPEALK